MNLGEAAFAFVQPSNVLFAALVVGLALTIVARGLGVALVAFAVLALGVLGLTPAGEAMLRPLEASVAVEPIAVAPAGIVLLGGWNSAEVTTEPDDIAINELGERLVAGAELARRWPDAKLIVSGGNDDPSRPSGADLSAVALEALGVPRARLVLETRALSTWDNAVFTRDLVQPRPGQSYVLVTSAWHMPRSLRTFARAGWPPMVPYPVDYRTTWGPLGDAFPRSLSRGLTLVDLAAREYVATLAYRLAGRLDAPPGG